jgi:hypothetical protein
MISLRCGAQIGMFWSKKGRFSAQNSPKMAIFIADY